MSDCFFCSRYLTERDCDGCREEVNAHLHHEYGLILLKLAWNDLAGRHHYSEEKIRPKPEGFTLKFCPECGRRLIP